jgi:hypothetical protein
MTLPIYVARDASPEEFVDFWQRQYRYPKDDLYTNNIDQPLTPERIHQLFAWKNGSRLSDPKRRSVEQNYIARLDELGQLNPTTDAEAFLAKFSSGGAVWRIFWLHCWQPNRFPIYDQHVHRAMALIEQGTREEIPQDDADKVSSYLNRYLPFHKRFDGIDSRRVDRALWFYGKFVKATQFPLP